MLPSAPPRAPRNPRFDALLAELKLILAKRARPTKPPPKPRRKSFSSLDQPACERPEPPREVRPDYYSKPDPAKCWSDDCLEYASSYGRRASVTEPNTPTAARAPALPESELSETESQSSVLSDTVSPVQRRGLSNSLESFHEPRTRRPKRAKVVRKASASSTSSYDARPEPVPRRMRKSASCHVKSKEARRDTCRCLVDASPGATKSLPRNHRPHTAISRHLNDALRCEKDCLKILKAVSKEVPTYSRRGDSEESYFEGRTSSLPKRNKTRYPKTAEIKKLRSVGEPALALVPPPGRFQTIDRYDSKREKPVDECVLRIEDGDLWIEICKAVQETEARVRKARPRD